MIGNWQPKTIILGVAIVVFEILYRGFGIHDIIAPICGLVCGFAIWLALYLGKLVTKRKSSI